MSQAKGAAKRKRRSKVTRAVPLIGAAGLSLSLANGAAAAAAGQTPDITAREAAGHEFTLHEEEISGVSLATFYVTDKEKAPVSRPRPRMAFACGGCGCGCSGCWTGRYQTPLIGGDPPPPATKPVRKHAQTAKPGRGPNNP